MQNIRLDIPLPSSVSDYSLFIEKEIQKIGEPLRWAIVKAKTQKTNYSRQLKQPF